MRIPTILLALLAVLVAAMLVSAGCTSTPPANATPKATTAAGTPSVTEAPTAVVTVNQTATSTVNVTANETAAAVNASFVNATWAWVARAGSEPVTVTSPDRYTVGFNTNGTYRLRADCNNGTGNFTVDGKKLKLAPANLTEVYCGDRSLDRDLVTALDGVTAFEMDSQGRLVLLMTNSNERLVFKKLS